MFGHGLFFEPRGPTLDAMPPLVLASGALPTLPKALPLQRITLLSACAMRNRVSVVVIYWKGGGYVNVAAGLCIGRLFG